MKFINKKNIWAFIFAFLVIFGFYSLIHKDNTDSLAFANFLSVTAPVCLGGAFLLGLIKFIKG